MAGSVSNSWLGFSLTPQANFTTNPTSTANPNNSNASLSENCFNDPSSSAHDITNPASSTTNPPASSNNSNTNAGNAHNSQLNHSDMVLRSDGSLCIMEALTRSNHAGINIILQLNYRSFIID